MTIEEILRKHGVAEEKLTEAKADFQTAVEAEHRGLLDRVRTLSSKNNKFEADLTERDAKIVTLGETIEAQKVSISKTTELETQLNVFKTAKTTELKSKWIESAKFFDVPDTHKDYARRNAIKAMFNFAEEGKELTPEQLTSNMSQYELLQKAGSIEFKPEDANYNDKAPAKDPPTGKQSMEDYAKSVVQFNS